MQTKCAGIAGVTTSDGWIHLPTATASAIRQAGEAVLFDMAAENYPLRDMNRVSQALHRLAEEVDRLSTVGGERGDGPARLSYHVSPAHVRLEYSGPTVERLLLSKGSKMAWIRYRREALALVEMSYRLVH